MFKTLIVEDSACFRQSLRNLLNGRFPSMGFEEAENGDEALEKTNALGLDLIVMDIRLPGCNGLEITKRIKADHPELPVVILTNYDHPEYRYAARQSGADHFLSKDASSEAILELVEMILCSKCSDTA
jgi:DNA-binding NarL/FixJ family response regulator